MSVKTSNHLEIDPLAQSLIDARKVIGYTQAEVALFSGVSLRTVVQMESGGNCTLKTLQAVAQCLRVHFSANIPKHRLPTLYEVWEENEARSQAERRQL